MDLKDRVRGALLHLVPLVVRRTQQECGPLRRILLIRPDHIGDVLFTTPALRRLRACLPEAHIAVLVGPWSRDALEGNKNIDELITWDFPWFNRRTKTSMAEPYIVLRELARSLQHYYFDAAVNLRFDFWWGALATYLAGIPRRIGYDIASCRPFLTHRIGYVPGRHEVEQNVGLIERFLGLPEERKRFAGEGLEFAISKENETFAVEYLRARGIREGEVLVTFLPGSGSPSKQWDAGRFARVGSELVRRYGCAIVVAGSPAERELASQIANGIGDGCVVAAGDTSLGQLAAILRRSGLAIGVDSGGMHLAVAVGTPTVHLFGPSDHRAFGPFGDEKKHKVVRSSLPCSPCGRFYFAPSRGLSDCMSSITVEQVLGEAAKLLNRQD